MISAFKKKVAWLCFCFVLISPIVMAYKAPMKYGKPSKEELEMQVYTPDSTAEAVVLCSYGVFNSNTFQFTQTFRIKILKEAGTKWGTKSVMTSNVGETSVRGKTFNIIDGKAVVSKLKKESIFKSKVIGSLYDISIAMPNVKKGSIIDIEISYPNFPSKWYFQALIPVRHSELILESTQYIEFQSQFFGYHPLKNMGEKHWVAKSVPAFKQEPYMDSYENYITKCEFDLARVTYPGYYKEYATSWKGVANRLGEHRYFGGNMTSGAGFLKEAVAEINANCSTPEEKIKAAIAEVKKIKWNNSSSAYTSTTSLGSVYKKKLGNSADINFILIKLLRKLDLKATPVALSRRSKGFLLPYMPSLSKLNEVICLVKLGEKDLLLDATDAKLPMGLLPKRVINGQGRAIYGKGFSKWVKLKPSAGESKSSFYKVSLTEEGEINGKVQVSYSDYAAFNKRKAIDEYNSEDEYLAGIESAHPGFVITNYTKKDESIYKRLDEVYEFEWSNYLESVDDLMMVNLFFLDRTFENVFKSAERIYPVKYPYCKKEKIVVMLDIPEGYTVSEVPKAMRIGMPDRSASFLVNYQKTANGVMMSFTLSIKKEMFLPKEYAALKTLFAELVKKEAEPVVIKKI